MNADQRGNRDGLLAFAAWAKAQADLHEREVERVAPAMEAWGLGFNLGNVVKYVARAEHKGQPVEDLEIARWYLDREIQRRKGLACLRLG